MGGVITGFAVIACIIATGYVIGRLGLLGENGGPVLSRLAFHVSSPALLFTTLSDADLSLLASGPLLITALSTLAVAAAYATVGAVRRWPLGFTTVGALCSGYVNAANLGIPIAAYVLGDASLVAPVLLFQLVIATPIGLTVLDVSTRAPAERASAGLVQRLTTPFRNPVVVGALAGVAVAASGRKLPGPVMEPFHLVGAMSVPAVLLAFGISLHGSNAPARGPDRGAVVLAVALKAVGQPLVAWALGVSVFHLSHAALFAVVVTSALPSAQNMFTYAVRYDVGTQLAREAVLLSTILAVPVLFATAAVLG